jgi:prepilin-type N-terminal cleavage/methylation domain-containing protein
MTLNKLNKQTNKNKTGRAAAWDWGFTLVELMVVITVIGILASLVLVGMRRVQTTGRDARRIADLQQVRNGLEVYFSRNLSYPQFTNSSWSAQSDPLPAALIGANIGIASVPVDPLNRAPFVYTYSSAAPWTGYVLRALLENNDNPALRDSPYGSQFGISCGPAPSGGVKGTAGSDSYYCTVL